ncbi:MAG: hypothetical protein H6640_13695 [Caldilineaceae bacterium]|nr:hypothetical protein [Caldilineaceae bacterium]
MDIDFVLVAVDAALAQARPTIWNSDQGSHFTSPQYIERLLAAEVRISMDGKGRALDNIDDRIRASASHAGKVYGS